MRRVESIPDAVRMTEGLRHSGYTPETAIADLIDNSVAAGAKKIIVNINKQVDQKYLVLIADDGCGMSEEILERAMQYGSDRNLAKSGLSVYGLGMKMASTTFTRKFSVITKEENSNCFTATYNLDEMKDYPWSFLIGESISKDKALFSRYVGTNSGTIIVWENADFQVSEQSPKRKKASGPRKNLVEDIEKYLGMVFHRFMELKLNDIPLEIFLNSKKVMPWNPVDEDFLHPEWVPNVEQFEQEVEIKGEIIKVPYTLTTYRLNAEQDTENTPGAWEKSRVGMPTQGIYVYRENRILQNPNWLNALVFHPDTNTLRATLELDPRLDEIIKTDVKKSGLQLSDEMWENIKNSLEFSKSHLKQEIKALIAKRKKEKSPKDLHNDSNKSIASVADDLPKAGVTRISPSTIEIDTLFGKSTTDISDVTGVISDKLRILVVDSLDNGFLWEPKMNGGDQVLFINKSHPFYLKIYLQLREEPLAIQGLDFLLFALATAELQTRTDRVREQFTQMRQVMSNTLRTLVLDIEQIEEFSQESE